MPETMTCADVVQEMRQNADVDICLPHGWIAVCREDPDDGDRVMTVTDEVLRIPPKSAHLFASALIGRDVDAMQVVVDAALEWGDAYDGLGEQMDDDEVSAGEAFGRSLTRFHEGNVGLKRVVDAYLTSKD